MSVVTDVLSAFGLTEEIAKAVLAAELDPTSANVRAVFAAYAANGQTPPAKLVTYLLAINERRHPEDTVRAAALPWILLGIAGIVLIWKWFK